MFSSSSQNSWLGWLCPQGVSARQKLLSLLTFVTGPEVLGVDLQEGSKALSPTMFLPTPEVPTPQPPSCKDRLMCVDFLMPDESQTCLVFDCVARDR